ncbi:MAG TPA: hypothetical protein VFW00_10990 [Rhodocyclaceae bacterium]|nr:hypothetical protein [Rhodocyclaceae bacterium]
MPTVVVPPEDELLLDEDELLDDELELDEELDEELELLELDEELLDDELLELLDEDELEAEPPVGIEHSLIPPAIRLPKVACSQVKLPLMTLKTN